MSGRPLELSDISEAPTNPGAPEYPMVVRDSMVDVIEAARAHGKLAGVYTHTADGHDIIHNPECRDGKHRNCDGTGWDTTADEPVPCPCECHGA